MANNETDERLGDEFFEQILSVPEYNSGVVDNQVNGFVGNDHTTSSMLLGLGHGDGLGLGIGGFNGGMGLGLPLGLNLDHVISSNGVAHNVPSSSSGINENESLHLTSLFPAFSQLQSHSIRAPPPSIRVQQAFQGHRAPGPAQAISHLPTTRPRMRARRGQATDPHSIAERLRRERIAERMRGLQELVPSCNKTDRAAMLDEIVDYVKFLRLQVKVLSMSRLGGAGAVAQLVADVPATSFEGEDVEGGQPAWSKWSNDGTEQQVAQLMEEDIGAAMQFLQSKALCMMPISLASAIFQSQPPSFDPPPTFKPEINPPQ
ncbi:hypothetical protein KSS87_020769 [Heliosperma pusillum]|nr:hypothetical protein KSS87_020769 [Heliosperma pusillum]